MNALDRLHGVESVLVDLQRGRVSITARPDEQLPLELIPQVLDAAGFRTGELQVAGRATLEVEGSDAWLRWQGWQSRMRVCEPGGVVARPGYRTMHGIVDTQARPDCVRLAADGG